MRIYLGDGAKKFRQLAKQYYGIQPERLASAIVYDWLHAPPAKLTLIRRWKKDDEGEEREENEPPSKRGPKPGNHRR